MSEIKIGEYVRTNEGYIGKLIEILPHVLNYYVIDCNRKVRHDHYYLYARDGFGFKHSFNIIDLIEEDDYVNGHLVSRIDNNITIWLETDTNLYKGIYEEDIKSILTKEQFQSIEYRLEE